MRPFTPALAASFALAFLLSSGCANRGMHAPPPDGGSAGTAGTGGAAGKGGSGGTSGSGGTAGSGGSAGTAGSAGTGAVDAGCNAPNPNPAAVDGATCPAKFNFESGLQGATIPATGQAAFMSVATSGADTFCGTGALAIVANFSGTSGTTTKGEVDLPIAAADMNFTGKTVTVHFTAVPGCSADLGFAVALLTANGQEIILPTFRPVGNSWKTESVTLVGDAGVAGAASVSAISLQAFSVTDYQGAIYIDEVDVSGP